MRTSSSKKVVKKTTEKPMKKSAIVKATSKEVAVFANNNDLITNQINDILSSEFDTIGKTYSMFGGDTKSLDRLSSDCLVFDLVTGGGFTPTGINQMAGMEGSAKTTTMFHTLGRALTEQSVGLINFNDAENTLDTEYIKQIFGPSFDENLLTSKKFRYSDQNILESYFDYIRAVMRVLPDKVWYEEVGSFCYRINKDVKQQSAFLERLEKIGVKPDKLLSTKQHFVIPTDSTSIQAALMLDSLPALITDKADDRESDEGGGMSERARVLAELLPKISGRIRRKGIVPIFINQLREKPGVMYGSPIYEPMGNAIKFFSAQRTWLTSRVPPDDSFKRDKEATQLSVEDNPIGGKDYYSFKEFRNVKNKAGTPFLKGWCRIWTNDPFGKGRGIDPVYDLWAYLQMTGQVSGKRVGAKGFKLLLPGAAKNIGSDDPINWHTFKLLVLAEKYGGRYLKKAKEEGYTRPPKLLSLAWSQMGKSTKGIELRAAAKLLANSETESAAA